MNTLADLGLDVTQVQAWFPHAQDEPYVLVCVNDQHIQEWVKILGAPVYRCYITDDLLEERAAKLGKSKAEILAAKLPDPGAVMAGDFGEILVYLYHAANIYPQAAIGPKKWQLKQDRNKPAPHSDVIHFVLPCWPEPSKEDLLICSEVKTKSTNGYSSPIKGAIEDISKDRTNRLARTLVWLRERACIEDLGEVTIEHLNRFINAIDHLPAKKRFYAVAVICSGIVKNELCDAPRQKPTGYGVVVISVPKLHQIYNAVFKAARKPSEPAPKATFGSYTTDVRRSIPMSSTLTTWIGDADALRYHEHFNIRQTTTNLAHIRLRSDDYYFSLVGELFERMRNDYSDRSQWARLGNALALFADRPRDQLRTVGVSPSETALFAAAAFYNGGFPASAYLTIRDRSPDDGSEVYLACFDLLVRLSDIRSQSVRTLLTALRRGEVVAIDREAVRAENAANDALHIEPAKWIPARVFQQLLTRFQERNIRTVLPNGGSKFWNPLVSSFLNRNPPIWEFFLSQIDAIQGGLLERSETFSLQMPTGAGKTALCETLLYWHLKNNPDSAAILLVPYRSLASELRWSLVKRLNDMDISARCAYGGTVPAGHEVRDLENTHVIVATPEALSGLLSTDASFYQRISLVICDEGHLLDGGARGVGLELLLARMQVREGEAPRFVFMSAIVPNIEEINTWLGGTPESVIQSDYRPALVEFARLQTSGAGVSMTVSLDMHPHEHPPATPFSFDTFLTREDFRWRNPETGRLKTYTFTSVKTQAIAAARKALPMGTVAVFAANKRGSQGVIGLAEELLAQLARGLNLPEPMEFAKAAQVASAEEYFKYEYGPEWTGTKAIAAGAILHHGDVPQETREVVERLLRREEIKFAICTNTLAEGVNLPIRTLILYSVVRRGQDGTPSNLLVRDIKNLVGRAGRAGATTKGLVICANKRQWPLVEKVACQAPGEVVTGFLCQLLERLQVALAQQAVELTNQVMEDTPDLHTLIDGVDATLIDLTSEEIGEDELIRLAVQIADQTFASHQIDNDSRSLLHNVFELRARRVIGVHSAGRLSWIRETGARTRMLDVVEADLLTLHTAWEDVIDPIDPTVLEALLEWTWRQNEFQAAIRNAYRLEDINDSEIVRDSFFETVKLWLSGYRFKELAVHVEQSIDDILRVHTEVITFVLQTIVEQGVAVLAKILESQGRTLAPAVVEFPEHLRFGVPTAPARVLAAGGVRHRSAAVELGAALVQAGVTSGDQDTVFRQARRSLVKYRHDWTVRLGALVVDNTMSDITSVVGGED